MHRRKAASGRLLLLVACLSAGMLAIGCYVLAEAYREVVDQTRRVATNLALTVERDIGRDLSLVDRSVRGIIVSLALPGLDTLPPSLRGAVLFDQGMNQEEFGAFLVLDGQGRVRDISGGRPLPADSFADRAYFVHHREDPSPDALIGPAIVSRVDGQSTVTSSRRLSAADGSFAGAVVSAIHLSHFRHAFERLDLGVHGSIGLVGEDGTILLRDPDLRAGPALRASPALGDASDLFHDGAVLRPSGFAIATGPDGVSRYYAFRQVRDLPLFVVVGLSVAETLAPWLHKLAVVGSLTLLLCAASVLLATALRRELLRRQQAEQRLRTFNHELEARVAREVAAREEAQGRLVASQRMEALGQLAGGVAHDLNNVLQAVSSANQLLSRPARAGRDQERLTGMIAEAAERGAAVTRRLLVFARQGEFRAEAVDAAALVRGLRELLVHTLGADVAIEVEAGDHPATVLVDRIQLETVLVNLATNARDAMEGRAGVLSIRVGRRRDPEAAGARAEHVCIVVEDTGCGMPPEVRARAREPFYTTKPAGKGTGLGLAMASGFAEQSGGRMGIESSPGVGTAVTLWLPSVAQPTEPCAVPPVAGRDASDGSARVLLVDDDAVVRELLAEELSALGYEVAQAGHAAAALALLDPASGGRAPDVLVTDLSMPGMDGLALIGEAHRRAPRLPAILVTGYAGDEMSPVRLGASQGEYVLLHKPLDVARIATHLAILLRASRPPAHRDNSPRAPNLLAPCLPAPPILAQPLSAQPVATGHAVVG